MRLHPELGARILAPIERLEQVCEIVRHCHEHWDGSGYPNGLAGEEIPLESRVILVCDAYHAMTTDRPYRKRLPVEGSAPAACAEAAGTQFDPQVVEVFLALDDAGARRPRRLAPPPSDSRQRGEVGAILRGDGRVVVSRRLVGLERAQRDHARPNAAQLQEVVLKGAVRPVRAAARKRRVHVPVLAPGDERKLQPQPAAFVHGVAVLLRVGRMHPVVRTQQRGYPVGVLHPRCEVEIIVLARDRAGVKIHGPAAEQPVVDPILLEQLVDPAQGCELLCLGGSISRRSATSARCRTPKVAFQPIMLQHRAAR